MKFTHGLKKIKDTIRGFSNPRGTSILSCAGVVDGTLMRMKKLPSYGDAYSCYNGYASILLLFGLGSNERTAIVVNQDQLGPLKFTINSCPCVFKDNIESRM